MTKMTNLDYAQYTYEVMVACSEEEVSIAEMVAFLDQSDVTACLMIGFILGKGVFTMDDIMDYIDSDLAKLTVESFVSSTWELIDKN